MKQIFLSIALATACLSTAPMAAQDKTNAAKTGGDHTDQGLEGLTDQLGLTGDQPAQVNAIHKIFAKKAKDLSAAAVMIAVATAGIIGLMVFVPKWLN